MPRWPEGHITKRTCPTCGDQKDFYAKTCRPCSTPHKPLLGAKGPDHPKWKGGTQVDRDGYIKTYAPDHPWPRRGGYVREHVRVMELHIGRRIRPNEIVHHVNHDKTDNRLSNLRLMDAGDHSRHHNLGRTVRRDPSTGRFLPAGGEV